MKKVIVIGSPGAGKSTFARKIRDLTNLPLFYLDLIWHKEDKTNISKDEFIEKLNEIIKGDSWIIDGNFGSTLEIRIKECDTIFLLDYPVDACIKGVEQRIGKKREEMPWIEEEFDLEFKKWIIDFPERELKNIYNLIDKYKEGKDVYIFHEREEANKYLQTVNGGNVMANMEDKLLFQGRASIRIVTRENKVIYIDPFMGDGYDLPADLILVTHEHYDHNEISLIKHKNRDCKIIRSKDAILNGKHQKYDLGYIKVEAVEAGNNPNHNINNCVGYILELSSGIKIYISGDTSTTKQMSELADRNIDYAFYCCDGVYNMGMDEAIKVAKIVNARNSIPYHIDGEITEEFDIKRAMQFEVKGKMIIENGQEITLKKE